VSIAWRIKIEECSWFIETIDHILDSPNLFCDNGKKVNLRVPFSGDAAIGALKGKCEIIWKVRKRLNGSYGYQYGIKLIEVLNEGHLKLELLILKHDEKK
jgi:hypothetical protein